MRSLISILLIVMTLAGGGQALAMRVTDGQSVSGTADMAVLDSSQAQPLQSDGLTLNEAVERVRKQYNGRIVSAETRVSGGREVHVIKVLTDDGKLKTVRVPGRRI